SFPCSVRTFRRHPGAQLLLQRANLLGGLREFRAEASGLPDLKLVAETGEGDLVLDAGVALERIGEDRPPLAVDLQHLARAIERRRKLLALVRVRRETRNQRLDLLEQRVASGIQGRTIEGGITIEALETIARQHRAERRRD